MLVLNVYQFLAISVLAVGVIFIQRAASQRAGAVSWGRYMGVITRRIACLLSDAQYLHSSVPGCFNPSCSRISLGTHV